MNYGDYLELRRRAEKRLTSVSAWPFLAFQSVAFVLMFLRGPHELTIAFLSGCVGLVFTAGTWMLVRQRSGANRERRREAIDETLDEAVSIGWPIEEPSPRELRLLASLLDDDLETRAGFGKAMVWLTAIGAVLWLPAVLLANADTGIIPFQGTGFEFFLLWLAMLGGTFIVQRRARRITDRRVRSVLDRATVWDPGKPKRQPEAAEWQDEYEAPAGKAKVQAAESEINWQLDADGEISDEPEATRRRYR